MLQWAKMTQIMQEICFSKASIDLYLGNIELHELKLES